MVKLMSLAVSNLRFFVGLHWASASVHFMELGDVVAGIKDNFAQLKAMLLLV